MGKNTNFVSHKKSKLKENGGPKLPLATDLVEGEIAINYAEDVETLSIKNESGDVVTFSSDNYYTEKKLGSGFTGENSGVTVTDVIGSGFTSSSITDVIIENEEIVSAALTDLDERKLDASAYTPSVELWVSGTGENAVAQKGGGNTASGKLSVAMGSGTTANGDYSVAEGQSTSAMSPYSHAEGRNTFTTGYGDEHAEGNSTSGITGSHAEGYGTIAINYSHAEGYSTKALSDYSHAEGYQTIAINYSHAEGYSSSAISYSHAEGNRTQASGTYSHAEGNYTIASGYSSHAEGNYTQASGESSHAEGYQTTANNQSEHASGQYNISSRSSNIFGDSGNTLFSVGNGTYGNNHNAFEIRQNGDIYITSGGTTSSPAFKLQDYIGSPITVDQVLDDTTSASTNPVSSKAVYDAVTENELVWANAFVVLSGTVSAHTANTEIHVTAADKASWANKIGYAAYDSNDKKINFYKNDTDTATSICYIDATDFIKDGMVSNVEIKDVTSGGSQVTCLVISFNTDAGKQDINIPLTDIFDASNYYTKSQTSGATELSTAFDTIDDLVGSGFTSSSITEVIIENKKIVSAALNNLDEKKLDASAYTPSVELWVSGTGLNSVVLKGSSGTASGDYSVAEGLSTSATSQSSHAEGINTFTTGYGGEHAEGNSTSGIAVSHAEGYGTYAVNYSHAEGYGTFVANYSHAEGYYTSGISYSHAEGYQTNANNHSHAEGEGTVANGRSSHAEGYGTKANGDYSHAEGNNTTASGSSSHAEGERTEANGRQSHAEGYGTKANGDYSHAEGSDTIASGSSSHAEGQSTSATSQSSHAEGSYTVANRYSSHAEGYSTSAMTDYSHAEGYKTKANGYYSHVEGQNTEANNKSEHASGQYNVSSSASTTFGDSGNTLFSVGNGTGNNARHNAFEIRQNGDIYCSDGTNDVKLQDTITATAANTAALGGLKLVKVTQAEYDALTTKDPNTLYVIVN